MPIIITAIVWDEMDEWLVDRDMCDAAVLSLHRGWTGTIHGFRESEWSIARDLMLAGF